MSDTPLLPLVFDLEARRAELMAAHPDGCCCVFHERLRAQREEADHHTKLAERDAKRRAKAEKGAPPCDSKPSV